MFLLEIAFFLRNTCLPVWKEPNSKVVSVPLKCCFFWAIQAEMLESPNSFNFLKWNITFSCLVFFYFMERRIAAKPQDWRIGRRARLSKKRANTRKRSPFHIFFLGRELSLLSNLSLFWAKGIWRLKVSI